MARGDGDLKKYKFKSKLRTTANKAKMRNLAQMRCENISKTDLNAASCSFVGRDPMFENQSNINNFNLAMERRWKTVTNLKVEEQSTGFSANEMSGNDILDIAKSFILYNDAPNEVVYDTVDLALVSPEGNISSRNESDDFTLNLSLDQIVVDANTNESDNVDYCDDKEECLTQYDCSFFDLNLISEKKEGLQSTFFFKCTVCNTIDCVRSGDRNKKDNVNLLAVLGTISTGNWLFSTCGNFNYIRPSIKHTLYTVIRCQLLYKMKN
ncbi:hypothetical protein FQA39_LY17267 [Lamprigera yunnana]|nr:hypothetical protein FQA39_LY17267 [Lamprigera yunnana]